MKILGFLTLLFAIALGILRRRHPDFRGSAIDCARTACRQNLSDSPQNSGQNLENSQISALSGVEGSQVRRVVTRFFGDTPELQYRSSGQIADLQKQLSDEISGRSSGIQNSLTQKSDEISDRVATKVSEKIRESTPSELDILRALVDSLAQSAQ